MNALSDFIAGGELFVLTGAGISTESGIPDYRRPDGSRRAIPMTFQEFMASPQARRRYWARSAAGWEAFAGAEPNAGHWCVAQLQSAGYVTHLVTQNVDGLHQRAGSVDVDELHGSLRSVVCVACGAKRSREDFQIELRQRNPSLPDEVTLLADGDAEVSQEHENDVDLVECRVCGADTLKPDVVMFGESVQKEFVQRQYEALTRSSRVLVLGSSLKVMSGYRFVLAALKVAKPVAMVGLGEMRGQERAALVVHDRLGHALGDAVRALELPDALSVPCSSQGPVESSLCVHLGSD